MPSDRLFTNALNIDPEVFASVKTYALAMVRHERNAGIEAEEFAKVAVNGTDPNRRQKVLCAALAALKGNGVIADDPRTRRFFAIEYLN